jgi:hypothetical protein
MPQWHRITCIPRLLHNTLHSSKAKSIRHEYANVLDRFGKPGARYITTAPLRHRDAPSTAPLTSSLSGYFSQNHDLTTSHREDIEDSWRRAQLSEDGNLPSEEAAFDIRKNARRSSQQLQAANAALSFDDDTGSQPSGLGHRDIIMRCTTIDSQGDISKRSESIPKSHLCTNHGLQVCRIRHLLDVERPADDLSSRETCAKLIHAYPTVSLPC